MTGIVLQYVRRSIKQFKMCIANSTVTVWYYLHRAAVGGPAGQAMAGPVLGLSKQYIDLETYKIILQLTIQIY